MPPALKTHPRICEPTHYLLADGMCCVNPITTTTPIKRGGGDPAPLQERRIPCSNIGGYTRSPNLRSGQWIGHCVDSSTRGTTGETEPETCEAQEESKMSETQHLSHSQISTYLTCPLRYKFHYVDTIPPEFTAAALVFGQAIHEAVLHSIRRTWKAMPAGRPVAGCVSGHVAGTGIRSEILQR